MEIPWKVILAFVGVFIAGAVFGGFFTARTAGKRIQAAQQAAVAPPLTPGTGTRPKENRAAGFALAVTPLMMQRLALQLKLTDDQKTKIRPIVARADEDWQRLRRENFRDTARVMERMHADIAEYLTADQRKDLETMKRNAQDRLRSAEKGNRSRGDLQRQTGTVPNGTGAPAASTTTTTLPASAPEPKGK